MSHYVVHIINKKTGVEQYFKEIFGHTLKEALRNNNLDNDSIILRGACRVR